MTQSTEPLKSVRALGELPPEERDKILLEMQARAYAEAGAKPTAAHASGNPALAGAVQPQAGLSIPVTLPSMGYYYDGLIPGGVVRINPFRGEQEAKLAILKESPNKALRFQVIVECVEFPTKDFDYRLLLVEDWLFLALRVIDYTYGQPYKVQVKCPHCHQFIDRTVPISTIEATPITQTACFDKAADSMKDEPFTTQPLPASGVVLTWHKQRIGETLEISAFESMEAAKGNLATSNYAYAKAISRINGKQVSILDTQQWVAQALAKDTAAFRKEIDAHAFGPEMRLSLDCGHCSYSFRHLLPLELAQFGDSD